MLTRPARSLLVLQSSLRRPAFPNGLSPNLTWQERRWPEGQQLQYLPIEGIRSVDHLAELPRGCKLYGGGLAL